MSPVKNGIEIEKENEKGNENEENVEEEKGKEKRKLKEKLKSKGRDKVSEDTSKTKEKGYGKEIDEEIIEKPAEVEENDNGEKIEGEEKVGKGKSKRKKIDKEKLKEKSKRKLKDKTEEIEDDAKVKEKRKENENGKEKDEVVEEETAEIEVTSSIDDGEESSDTIKTRKRSFFDFFKKTKKSEDANESVIDGDDKIEEQEDWVEDKKIKPASNSFEINTFNGVYEMNTNPRGICLIINNDEFNSNEKRKGSELDVKALHNVWKQLHFKVKIERNKTKKQMDSLLNKYAKVNYDKYEALVIIIMSHGTSEGVCGTDDDKPNNLLPIKSIYKKFNGKDCPSLVGKPKLFFLQMSPGEKKQSDEDEDVEDIPLSANISDVLVCISTVEGYVSYRNTKIGSYYIQYLRDVLVDFAAEKHMIEIINDLGQRVRRHFDSNAENYTQIASYESIGFFKNLYFKPYD